MQNNRKEIKNNNNKKWKLKVDRIKKIISKWSKKKG